MKKESINYSQCWEDPRLLAEALSISRNDYVLSITSGGDNTIALLLDYPKKIISIDTNPAQSRLLELKMAALRSLNYQEYLEFLGVKESKIRKNLLQKLLPVLSPTTRKWCLQHLNLIKGGIIHCGRFEQFIAKFIHALLPLVHSKKNICGLLSCCTIQEQRAFYHATWDTVRWKLFFSVISSQHILQRYARAPGMFTQRKKDKKNSTPSTYKGRFSKNISTVSISDNFFIHYLLTGQYGNAVPPYIEERNFLHLQKMPTPPLTIVTHDLLSYLRSVPENTFSKFNLSDIFEVLSPSDNDTLWIEIVRTAKNNAVVAYWNNLVPRSYPSHLSHQIQNNKNDLRKLCAKDRVFFYSHFSVHTILK